MTGGTLDLGLIEPGIIALGITAPGTMILSTTDTTTLGFIPTITILHGIGTGIIPTTTVATSTLTWVAGRVCIAARPVTWVTGRGTSRPAALLLTAASRAVLPLPETASPGPPRPLACAAELRPVPEPPRVPL